MSFGDYMVDTITLADRSGVTGGTPSYDAQYTAVARVEDSDKKIIGTDGNELQAEHVIATETAIKTTTRIWLPGDDTAKNEEARRAIKIKHAREADGSGGHYEVYL